MAKNVFLIEFSTDILLQVASALKEKGVEVSYLTSAKYQSQYRELFPKATWHNSLLAAKGEKADNFSNFNFSPPSLAFIESLYSVESQAMTMMNRMDYGGIGFYEKKRVYYEMLSYWQGVLQELKPEAIIFSIVPHMVYDFVLYSIAKQMGIKTLMFEVVKLADRLLVLDDIEQNGKATQNYLATNNNASDMNDLSDEVRDYYLKITSPQTTYYPFYVSGGRFQKKDKLSILPSLKSILRAIKQGNFFSKVLMRIKGPFGVFSRKSHLTTFGNDFSGLRFDREKKKWQKMKQGFQKEYQALAIEVDLTKPFIFFPLQYQPERTTSPMAGVFSEQFLIADILSSCLPPTWQLYIKEHPSQWAEKGTHAQQGRFNGYYEMLNKLPNTKLVKMDIATNDLILKAQAVATATGTAGWEAVLKGKPALIFGFPFYQFADGVLKVASKRDCLEAIEKIKNGFTPSKQKVLDYLTALDKVSIKGHLGYRFEKNFNLSDNEAIKNITCAIYAKL